MILIMRKVLFLLLCISLCTTTYSQSCEEVFIKKITKAYVKIEKNMKKNAITKYAKYKDSSEFDDIVFVCIPEISCYKRFSGISVNKTDVLCIMNCKKARTTSYTIVYNDTIYLGTVFSDLYQNSSGPLSSKSPIFRKLIELNPSVVFKINGIPEAFFYIKNNELFALVFEWNNPTHMQVYDSKTYWNSIYKVEEYDSFFLND